MSDQAAAVPRELLDAPVRDLDIAKIASYLTNWEALSPYLGLTGPQEEEIRNTYRDYAQQKRQVLRKWKRVKGKAANYRAFIAAASDISDTDLADNVRSLLGASLGSGSGSAPDMELQVSLPVLQNFTYKIRGEKLNIIEKTAPSYKTIGINLLNDRDGSITKGIEMANAYKPEPTMVAIYEKWITAAKDHSWKKLICCLKDCDLNVLALDIEDALKENGIIV